MRTVNQNKEEPSFAWLLIAGLVIMFPISITLFVDSYILIYPERTYPALAGKFEILTFPVPIFLVGLSLFVVGLHRWRKRAKR